MLIAPKDGFAWNPLRDYPRNLACFCGSGGKAKRCCLPKQFLTVESKLAGELQKYMNYVKTGQGQPVKLQITRGEEAKP